MPKSLQFWKSPWSKGPVQHSGSMYGPWLRYRQYLKWRPMFRQMWESTLCQTMHVRVACDTHKVQKFDWPKWRCAIWHYAIYRLLSDQRSFHMAQQNELLLFFHSCKYNCQRYWKPRFLEPYFTKHLFY